MNKISSISIVSSTRTITYEIGFNGIAELTEEIRVIAKDTKASYIIGYDKEGNEMLEVSKATPMIIERF